MINQACGKSEDSKNNFNQETGIDVSSYKIDTTKEILKTSESNQVTENETIDYVIYNDGEIEYEDLDFIDENIFKVISEVNSGINYYGAFENEDIADSKSIMEKYYNAVIGNEAYIDIPKEKGYLEGKFNTIRPDECTYYYFDMDKDGIRELIISDNTRYVYFFKYDVINNEIELICTTRTTIQLLGDNKISDWRGGVGFMYSYYELDKDCEMKSEIRFYSESYINNKIHREDEVFMVGFPEDSEVIEKLKKMPKERKVEVYYDDFTGTHYFKITEEQYNQLTEDYFKSKKEAEENIKKVTYSFDDLFIEFK